MCLRLAMLVFIVGISYPVVFETEHPDGESIEFV